MSRAFENEELVPEGQDLSRERSTRANPGAQGAEKEPDHAEHPEKIPDGRGSETTCAGTRGSLRRGNGLDHRLAETSGGGPAPFDGWDWQVGIQASIPLFTGGARAAARGRTSEELLQLQSRKRAVAQRIEQRVRAAMHLAGASNAGIGLANAGAEAARKNLDLVADAYSQGMVSIIELLDAQSASFVADLAAANALHDFLLDLMEVERAVGGFSCLGTPAEREAYFAALAAYFEEHGAHPARREPNP